MSKKFIPPKPVSRPDGISKRGHIRRFRNDLFSSQPERLYRAWMAEFRLPFFRSFFVNQPDLVEEVLKNKPDDFPKSPIIGGALYSLLGKSVFVTNGALWKRQRRIIDPSFEGGRLHESFPAMVQAAQSAVIEWGVNANGKPTEIEAPASRLAADIIFRTLFSIPISENIAQQTYTAFQNYQRTQPLLNTGSFFRSPRLIRFFESRETRKQADHIRNLLTKLTADRERQIKAGNAPNDLATRIMTTDDPETGTGFTTQEMVDQVGIFFLAGHETSASALSWTLYLLANSPDVQAEVYKEISNLGSVSKIEFKDLSKLKFTRDVFREALRLYPPVPMMIRQATKPTIFRKRPVPKGSQLVISPFHLQRHERIWEDPDVFDPYRWQRESNKQQSRDAYIPFSTGPRVCTGAGFAMIEGVVSLIHLINAFEFKPVSDKIPQPVAHLTLRSLDGIYVSLTPR